MEGEEREGRGAAPAAVEGPALVVLAAAASAAAEAPVAAASAAVASASAAAAAAGVVVVKEAATPPAPVAAAFGVLAQVVQQRQRQQGQQEQPALLLLLGQLLVGQRLLAPPSAAVCCGTVERLGGRVESKTVRACVRAGTEAIMHTLGASCCRSAHRAVIATPGWQHSGDTARTPRSPTGSSSTTQTSSTARRHLLLLRVVGQNTWAAAGYSQTRGVDQTETAAVPRNPLSPSNKQRTCSRACSTRSLSSSLSAGRHTSSVSSGCLAHRQHQILPHTHRSPVAKKRTHRGQQCACAPWPAPPEP